MGVSSKLNSLLVEIFGEESEEVKIINEAYDNIVSTASTTSGEAKTQMIVLDHLRVKLTTIYFMLCRSISKQRNSYRNSYDSLYTRLVKLGRPSAAAIEAEIRANSSDYVLAQSKIESYEQIKDLVSSYIRSIDANKQTNIEILRDSRRID